MSEGLRIHLEPGMLPPQSIPEDGLVHVLNDWLFRHLKASGVRALWLGEWVACENENATWQVKVMAEEVVSDGRLVRMNTILQIHGQAVVEPVLGHGPTFLKAVEDAVRTCEDNVLPVLLTAFFDRPQPEGAVDQAEVAIDGVKRRVTMGSVTTWGRLPEIAPGQLDLGWLREFTKRLKGQKLPPGTHWVRLYYNQRHRAAIDCEVTLDNRPWKELQAEMAGISWPKSEAFYRVRLFLVIEDL
jgi:hypothetical protein